MCLRGRRLPGVHVGRVCGPRLASPTPLTRPLRAQCKLFNVQHQVIFALINALDADRTSGAALKTLVEFVVRGAGCWGLWA